MSIFNTIISIIEDLLGIGSSLDKFADPKKPFYGYGLVNNWYKQDPRSYMNKIAENEVDCVAFEFFECARPDNFKNVDKLLSKFEKYISLSQSKKILLYVTLVNCNTGSGKYGDPRIPLSKYDAQIKKAAQKFASWMKKYSNIYVTPCGEGGSSYDKGLQNYCKSIMPKSKMVNNWGSRPTSTDGMGFFCQHPAKTSSPVAGGAWSMSDHSQLIDELNHGGLYGTCNYEVTKKYAQKMRANNHPFIYYHFNKDGKIDSAALKALKDA